MPWFQELSTGPAATAIAESKAARRIAFLDGIRDLTPIELARSFAGEPVVDDPRAGHIDGKAAFIRYVKALREWLISDTAGVAQPVRVTQTDERLVEEVSVKLNCEHPELPVAVVTDLADDGLLHAVRVYHSMWPLTGAHFVRPPLLSPDPSLELGGAPADYQRGLAAGDAEAVVASFEPDGEVREPAGGPFRYRGEAHHAIYGLMFASGGGIPLKFCTVTDDGVACAIEYICDRWGKDTIPAQAGVAVYERGASGRLAAARIYDDVTPPASSDSSVQTRP